MKVEKVKLEGEAKELLERVSGAMSAVQSDIDAAIEEYAEAAKKLEAIKEKIRPLRKKLSPLAELQAGIASRKSRAKYFPEFATRNFDDSKDQEFYAKVREALK